MKKLILIFLFTSLSVLAHANEAADAYIVKAPTNLQDRASLQRGAQIFINNCLGCHSLKYLRYERIADDLGIPKKIMQDNLMFTSDKIGEPVLTALTKDDAKKWFGAVPPDLTLEARLRGKDWVYSYLLNFYPDAKRPWGVNNHVFPEVGMPNVLEVMKAKMSKEEFEKSMADLTNFLEYAAEPMALKRQRIGVYVLIFLAILFVPIYFLNKEYWKDVK